MSQKCTKYLTEYCSDTLAARCGIGLSLMAKDFQNQPAFVEIMAKSIRAPF